MSDTDTEVLLKKIDMAVKMAKDNFRLGKYTMIINIEVFTKNIIDEILIVDIDGPIYFKEISNERD